MSSTNLKQALRKATGVDPYEKKRPKPSKAKLRVSGYGADRRKQLTTRKETARAERAASKPGQHRHGRPAWKGTARMSSSLAQRGTTKRKSNGHERISPRGNLMRQAHGLRPIPPLSHNPVMTRRTGRRYSKDEKRSGKPS